MRKEKQPQPAPLGTLYNSQSQVWMFASIYILFYIHQLLQIFHENKVLIVDFTAHTSIYQHLHLFKYIDQHMTTVPCIEPNIVLEIQIYPELCS